MNHSWHSRFVWKLNILTAISLWLIQSLAHIPVCIRVEMRQYRHWTKCVGQARMLAHKIIDKWKMYRNRTQRPKPSVHIIQYQYQLCESKLCLSAQQFLFYRPKSNWFTDIFTYRLRSGLDVYGAATSLIFNTRIAVIKMHITFMTVSKPETMPQITNSTGI